MKQGEVYVYVYFLAHTSYALSRNQFPPQKNKQTNKQTKTNKTTTTKQKQTKTKQKYKIKTKQKRKTKIKNKNIVETITHLTNHITYMIYHHIDSLLQDHDDVINWKHFPRYSPFLRGIHRSPVNSPHKGQWRGALMFSLICAWINDWVNNREAGDLRRHRAHCDVIVMLR